MNAITRELAQAQWDKHERLMAEFAMAQRATNERTSLIEALSMIADGETDDPAGLARQALISIGLKL